MRPIALRFRRTTARETDSQRAIRRRDAEQEERLRGGAAVIAGRVTTLCEVGLGALVTAVDHAGLSPRSAGGSGDPVQTVTSVGYGDIVPTNSAGRLFAAVVMLVGLAFLSVITAAITSSFVAQPTSGRDAPRAPPRRLSTTCARSTSGLAALKPCCKNGRSKLPQTIRCLNARLEQRT